MNTYPISNVDLSIIIGYLSIVFFIGLIVSRKEIFAKDLFLAGRSLGWGAIGFSLFASNISGSTIIGLSGQAYSTGISVSNYEWMATIILVFMALYIIPFFFKNKITTIPEFLELRFNSFTRKYFSGATILLNIIVDTAGSLYGGALVLHLFFPFFEIWQICMILALVAGIYTSIGGLGAVVYTDILQAIIILMGSSILCFAVMGQFDFSWANAVNSIPDDHMSFIRPSDDDVLPWTGTMLGLPILGFYYWVLNQQIAQRVLAAKTIQHARWGALLGGGLKLSIVFLMVIPGAFALSLFPSLENFDTVFPTMITSLLPAGVLGIVLAGLIAAIMSSVDSALNASSTLIVMDFIKMRQPDLPAEVLVRYGRITILLLMIVASLWAPFIGNFEGLFAYLQMVLTYAVPPLVVVFVLGVFWEKGTAKAAGLTLVLGHVLGLGIFFVSNNNWLEIHYTLLAAILTLCCSIIFIGISSLGPSPERNKMENVTWKYRDQSLYQSEEKWYVNYRILSFLLLTLTLLVVFLFW